MVSDGSTDARRDRAPAWRLADPRGWGLGAARTRAWTALSARSSPTSMTTPVRTRTGSPTSPTPCARARGPGSGGPTSRRMEAGWSPTAWRTRPVDGPRAHLRPGGRARPRLQYGLRGATASRRSAASIHLPRGGRRRRRLLAAAGSRLADRLGSPRRPSSGIIAAAPSRATGDSSGLRHRRGTGRESVAGALQRRRPRELAWPPVPARGQRDLAPAPTDPLREMGVGAFPVSV